ADRLGLLLNQQGLGLVLLSACQSAAVAGEEAMGSVAARLTQAGIPSVVAMPYSVLIHTTRDLFATFYENLVQRKGIGASLDNARRRLMTNPKRGERQRGQDRIPLNLEDWFIPNLYQSGVDTPLLIPPSPPYQGGDERQSPPAQGENAPQSPPYQGGLGGSNLPPAQESGFHGRTRELWQIERAFVRGTHRITLHGFGGQGKTALACEAARWLQRTGMFQRICFVDYNAFQGEDAVSLAVAALSTVLEQSLLDADAATAALHRTPTLLILDNLETLER
ncbi:MAG: CHAT domain-containing protein, partial [Cyanobacteria bacterium J06638_22]